MSNHPLVEAVLNHDVVAVRQLLDQGSDPNVCIDQDELTPLHFIAQSNHDNALLIAKILMEAGGNPDAMAAGDLLTPCEVARLHGNWAMVDLLQGSTAKTWH